MRRYTLRILKRRVLMGKNKNTSAALRGADGFEQYYAGLFGSRWTALKNALSGEPPYAEWKAGGRESYFLDTASVRAAVSLPLKDAGRILDLCAAPGGKTLVLASLMADTAGLSSNERSPERKQRLVRVCDACLPESIRARVTVSCSDGALWCTRQTECFDAILLDAPCSSERHVLADNKYLSQWSPARIKTVAMEQWALLSSAYRMLAPGGYLLYSTCALSPAENDGMIERLFKKFDDAGRAFGGEIPPYDQLSVARFCSVQLPSAEKTQFGFHILPDMQGGAGPIYFSLIVKNSK